MTLLRSALLTDVKAELVISLSRMDSLGVVEPMTPC